ncbi:MAG: ATP-binding protein [Lachnospiraceae bacterium]|jgi:AAA15 family ATPase/GTPase|nr:ATP-binding protein [Lachnospiraceae bacterium]
MVQKIKKIIIENIKNVEHGEISFVEKGQFLNVMGIYGQNGSGKTTLIDVLEIVQDLILGRTIKNKVSGMMEVNKIAQITVITEILDERENTYYFELEKSIDNYENPITNVICEKLLTKLNKKYSQQRQILSFDSNSQDIVVANTNEVIASIDALSIIKDVSSDKRMSYLFNSNFKKLIDSSDRLKEQKVILDHFRSFAKNIRVYTSEYSGLIAANIMTPVGMHYQDDNMNLDGVIPFQMQERGGFIPQNLVEVYKTVIKQINLLLPEIIPGLKLDIIEREVRLGQNGVDEVRLEFIANRDNKRFSLQYESDGIKKIIGLILFLVEVYNNPSIIAAIDEFDSDIFEYLLGELVDVMSTGAKGQLIFTSHNLRVLEMLPKNKIIFSTANSKNRYICMKGVKRTNNLRDFYIRAIQLGGQDEDLYEGQSSNKIRMALIKAGDRLG